ncbi:MAG TPA: cobalt ECF transporter T component CbiQ [Methanomassiliicoccales archaeon]|nr:cobalt ECF transporter T component CbiQ [Methanomassiliicoccales archaeon]
MTQITVDEIAYESRLRHWPPLGKLLFTLSLLISSLVASTIVVPIIILIVGLVLMFYSTGFRLPRVLIFGIIEALVVITITCIVIMLITGGETVLSLDLGFVQLEMGREGLALGSLVFFRALAGITVMLFFATSTPIPHIAYAMRQLRVPKELIELTILVYRYSFLMLEELGRMYDAAKCRLGFRGLRNRVRTSGRLAVGLFIRSMGTAERTHAALQCRNFKGDFPVYRKPSRLTPVWGLLPILTFEVLFCTNILVSNLTI